MKPIILRPTPLTGALAESLEAKGLLTWLKRPKDVSPTPAGQAGCKDVYRADPRYGPHKLLFVDMHLLKAELNYHPDNEEVLLIEQGVTTKPLIFVTGLLKEEALQAKINLGTLESTDFAALIPPFGSPELSFFTVNAGTPHCEMTTEGPGECPSFWVTEPADLPMVKLDLRDYVIQVEGQSFPA